MRRIKIEGTSVGANYEIKSPPPDMKCPELPDHGMDNFWLSACKIKQQIPDYHKTCYPQCKHKRKQPPQQASSRSDRAIKLAARVCQLYQEGNTIEQIAEQVSRSTKLVTIRLHEAGLISAPPTKKELVLAEWRSDPDLPDSYIMDKYKLTSNTVASYRRDFRRKNNIVSTMRGKVFAWLKQHPDASVKDIMKNFALKERTASSYHSQFNK